MENLRILVVDDDIVTRTLIEKRLKKRGYREVETVEDGEKAVRMISAKAYDVVLTDLMMPGSIDGIGVLEAVKAGGAGCEVILITAFGSFNNAVDAIKKGAYDYLTKPLDFEELFIHLEQIETMKALAKEALDLRESIDVTEENAGMTIRYQEILVARLKERIDAVKKVLTDTGFDAALRVKRAVEILSSPLDEENS